MTRRPLSILAVLVLCWSGCCQSYAQAPAGPHDSGAEFKRQEYSVLVPTPAAPELAPEYVAKPLLAASPPIVTLKDRYELGEPIEIGIAYEDSVGVEIEMPLAWRPQAGPGHDIYAWAAAVGKYPLRLNWATLDNGKLKLAHIDKTVNVVQKEPDPPPPPVVPLSELVDAPTAKALVDMYAKILTVNSNTNQDSLDDLGEKTSANFWACHDAGLASIGLLHHAAEAAIKERFLGPAAVDPLDLAKVRLAMRAVMAELGQTPTPPGPTPGPAPIAAEGFRVLIVEETANRNLYSPEQRAALMGTAPGSLRSYLDAHCVAGPDGKTPERLVLDDDNSVDYLPAYWKPAWDKRPREEEGQRNGLPWMVASNGKAGYVGPLVSTEQALQLLAPIGGK